jgi:hypothetical protein
MKYEGTMSRLVGKIAGLSLGLLVFGSGAFAEPLVTMEGGTAKPGVVTAWSGADKKIELTLKAGADANAVAAAISANVDKAKTKVSGGKVLVLGLAEADLLKALAEVNFGEDDLGALAAAAASDESVDSGSSLRAKKTADLDKIFKDQKVTALGQVVAVEGNKLTDVVVSVKILRAPTGDLAKTIRKGGTVKFKPVLKMNGANPDLSDANTQLNLGAYYLEKGDKVQVKIGADQKGTYAAEIITR